jgi:biopolymer transport protein ExbD
MTLNDDKPYDDINITPMLDLAYVLLVIFILMTTTTIQGKRVTLPRASNTPPPKNKNEKPKLKVITIQNDGSMLMGKDPIKIDQIAPLLKAHKAQHADFPVLIQGDSQTQYQLVSDVLDIVAGLGLKQIGLPTKAKGS